MLWPLPRLVHWPTFQSLRSYHSAGRRVVLRHTLRVSSLLTWAVKNLWFHSLTVHAGQLF